jgi:short-subunit dehydrogenase
MLHKRNRIVIIGATSAIAEHCARLWAKQPTNDFILVGRDLVRTEQIASDLKVRNPETSTQCRELDFSNADQIRSVVNDIIDQGAVDVVLIAHGSLPDQQKCQQDLALCHDSLIINGVSPVLFAEAFAGHMQSNNAGTLILISSVAGDRGRKSNYVYGAAKGLVTRYAQGLQHRLASSAVKVVLIKPGPTATPMTRLLQQQGGSFAKVEDVAKAIVNNAAKGNAVVYAPAKWALIMLIIRHLPNFIFKRLNI